MAEPKQKSIEPLYVQRNVPLWTTPAHLGAELWRQVVYNQPIVTACQDAIMSDIVASKFEIRPRDAEQEEELQAEIEHYTNVANPRVGNGVSGFDPWVIKMLQDVLTLPIGGNSEIVRWPVGTSPFRSHHPKGHVSQIVYIDGATLTPLNDPRFIMAQRLAGDPLNAVFFEEQEIGRMVWSPRVEMALIGYGMPPVERVYLAVQALYRSDSYYANLLLDTPEAGLLDLMDMSFDAANEWTQSFRELLTGVDPFKVSVLYEHTKEAKFIPFGLPPTEMMFKEITQRFTQIVHAGFGLSVSDTGLGEGGDSTLAGSIRDERKSQRSGYARAREAIKTFFDNEVLPPSLEFVWVVMDEEARTQSGRSLLLLTSALEKLLNSGVIDENGAQAILKREGFLDENVELPDDVIDIPSGGIDNLTQNEIDKVPAIEGGRGDINVQRATVLGDPAISSVPTQAPAFDQLAVVLRENFDKVIADASDERMMRLIKKATRLLYPQTQKALIALQQEDIGDYLEQRCLMWLNQASGFDDIPDVIKASQDILDELDDAMDDDRWYEMSPEAAASIAIVLSAAYSQGATIAADEAWKFLYTEGLVSTPSLEGFTFNLSNPATLAKLEDKAAQLVVRVNEGTKFYLKRSIASGVEAGLSTPNIAQLIKDGADVEEVLRQSGFSSDVIARAKTELEQMTDNRINSIANTEIAKAETEGRVGQWQEMGLEQKRWAHTGPDTPCPVCQNNIDLDFVSIDYMYDTVFGAADTIGPPAHPDKDHCHIEFSEDEMMDKADKLEVWDGS